MTTPTPAIRLLLAAALWCGAAPAADAAPDPCAPSVTLPKDQAMTMAVDITGARAWLEARLERPLVLPASALGVAAGADRLTADTLVRDVALGRGLLRDDQATLRAEAGAGPVVLAVQERRFTALVDNGAARDADGRPLPASPNLEGLSDIEIGAGAILERKPDGQVAVQPGALLTWRDPQGSQPLKFFLERPARLVEIVPAATAQVVRLSPALVPHGGKLDLALETDRLGPNDAPPVFCLQVGQRKMPLTGRFSKQEGKALHFELRVEGDEMQRLLEDSEWLSRVRGVPASIRTIVNQGGRPVLDAEARLHLSSWKWSAAVGVGAVLALLVICMACMRAGPARAVAELIQHESGRLSLSNLQFLLWTVAAFFALVFTWLSTDTLLPLTPVLGLLGIAGTSSVLARGVERGAPDPTPVKASERLSWRTLLVGGDGRVELLRFQMLAFTLFAWCYSLYSIIKSNGFPQLPDSLYWLMGISNATYVSAKVPDVMAANRKAAENPAPATPPADALPADQVRRLQNKLGVADTGVLDEATRTAVARYKQQNDFYPADGKVLPVLLKHLGV